MNANLLGSRLRAARESKGMSLRALAAAIGVSPSLISQVETGKTKPSVSTLYTIVSQLGISTDSLLSDEETTITAPVDTAQSTPAGAASSPAEEHSIPTFTANILLQRASDNPVLEMENGVRWERLAGIPEGNTQALLVTYRPGGASSIEGKLMRHVGIEHVYLVSGELNLQLEFDTHVLHAGDSIVFDSQRPHMFSNTSSAPASGVWHVVGRPTAPTATPEFDATGVQPTNAVTVLRAFGT